MVLDSSTRDYLWEISEVVKQADGRPADAELIVANMLAEIAGKEAEQLQNVLHDGFGERLAIVKVPRLGVEAVFTVVRAAGNKEADTDAGSICNVPRLNCRIVHR